MFINCCILIKLCILISFVVGIINVDKTKTDLEVNINKTLNKLEKLPPCKEVAVGFDNGHGNYFSPYYSVDNETLNHAMVKRNSTGHLTYFEIKFAVQADTRVDFHLSGKRSDLEPDTRFDIDIGQEDNQYTALDIATLGTWTPDVKRVPTPDILSSTQFRAFYMKVDDGTMEFGKEGDTSPLISYNDAGFGSINYFRFSYYEENVAKIRFDCPAPAEGSS